MALDGWGAIDPNVSDQSVIRREVEITAGRILGGGKRAANLKCDYVKEIEFIEFILDKYIEDGVQELAAKKMRSLVELKYNTISDATAEFGSLAAIRDTFISFQKYLYE